MPWSPIDPLSKILSPGRAWSRREFKTIRHQPNSRGVDEELIAASLLDNLGIAGHNLHTGIRGCLAERVDHPAQLARARSLLPE